MIRISIEGAFVSIVTYLYAFAFFDEQGINCMEAITSFSRPIMEKVIQSIYTLCAIEDAQIFG